MIVKEITADEVRNSDARNYNPSEWDKKIDRFLAYGDTVFYIDQGAKTFYVEYTVDGIRFFAEFDYGSAMTSGGFYPLIKSPIADDGRTFHDAVALVRAGKDEESHSLVMLLEQATKFKVSTYMLRDEDGQLGSIAPHAREYMRKRTSEVDDVFTKMFIR